MWLVIDGEMKEIFANTAEYRRLMLLQTLIKSYNTEEDSWVYNDIFELLDYINSVKMSLNSG